MYIHSRCTSEQSANLFISTYLLEVYNSNMLKNGHGPKQIMIRNLISQGTFGLLVRVLSLLLGKGTYCTKNKITNTYEYTVHS